MLDLKPLQILEEYLDFTQDTECPTQFHRWSFLSAVAAALGRRGGLPFGHGNIWPNMYVILIGATGTRKSTAISITKKLLMDAGYKTFTSNKTTKPKFLLDMSDGFDVTSSGGTFNMLEALDATIPTHLPMAQQSREAYIVADELVDFTGLNNYDFLTTLTTLWDCLPFYSDRIKNTQSVHIPNPTVNLMGGATPANLQKVLPQEMQGHGFLSRTVFIYSEPSGNKITFPKVPDETERQKFVEFFREVLKLNDPITLSDEARAGLDAIYHKWENTLDIRFDDYASRRLIHLFKLSIICAALRLDTNISIEDVIAANTLLLYTEASMPRALGEFGMAKSSHVMQKIMQCLERNDGPMKGDNLYKEIVSDIERPSDFTNILGAMQAARKIKVVDDFIVISKREPINFGRYVDYKKYIREYVNDPHNDPVS